jgi:hypothetical protein
MPPLSTTSAASSTLGTVVTVNPYVYLATLSRSETYALLLAAAVFGIMGAVLIQREAVARLFRRR